MSEIRACITVTVVKSTAVILHVLQNTAVTAVILHVLQLLQ